MIRETLTLASASPRRRQLLEMLGIPVRVVPSNIPEVRRTVETPVDYVERLAREKALSVPGDLVLGADTTVVVRDEVLEKPLDEADALRMLRKLQGRTHQVVTSVALVADETVHQATDVTNVTFRRLDDDLSRGLRRDRRADGQGGGLRHPGLRRGAGGADRRRLLQRDGAADPAGARRCSERAGHAYRFEGGRNGRAAVTEVALRLHRRAPGRPAPPAPSP